MPTYFHPLRRKIGVAILPIACWLAMRWALSYGTGEHFFFIMEGFESKEGHIHHIRRHLQGGKITYQDDGSLNLPYWTFVTPLALLSAYLLLSKPRAKTFGINLTTP